MSLSTTLRLTRGGDPLVRRPWVVPSGGVDPTQNALPSSGRTPRLPCPRRFETPSGTAPPCAWRDRTARHAEEVAIHFSPPSPIAHVSPNSQISRSRPQRSFPKAPLRAIMKAEARPADCPEVCPAADTARPHRGDASDSANDTEAQLASRAGNSEAELASGKGPQSSLRPLSFTSFLLPHLRYAERPTDGVLSFVAPQGGRPFARAPFTSNNPRWEIL